MLKNFLIMTLFSAGLTSFAQTAISNATNYNVGGNDSQVFTTNGGAWVTSKLVDTGVEGSTYVFKNWSRSKIHAIDGSVFSVPYLNLNSQNSSFEAKMSNGVNGSTAKNKNYIFDGSKISKVEVGNRTFFRLKIEEGFRFMEFIYNNDDLGLYKLHYSYLKSSPLNPLTQQKQGKDKVMVKLAYYKKMDGEVIKIKLKKKELYAFYGDHKDEMVKYVKENRLSVKEDDDLLRIFRHLNTL